jgi:hypothetical protein
MTDEQVRAILGWLEGAEHQHTDHEGNVSYRVILPESLLVALTQHLRKQAT